MSKHSPPLTKRRDLALPALMPTGRSGEKLLTEQLHGSIDARYRGGALCILVNFPAGLALLGFICYNVANRQGLGASGGEDFL